MVSNHDLFLTFSSSTKTFEVNIVLQAYYDYNVFFVFVNCKLDSIILFKDSIKNYSGIIRRFLLVGGAGVYFKLKLHIRH